MGPVKTQIVGAVDLLREEAAARVREDMNYQLTEVMTEYRPEHEKMLWSLPTRGFSVQEGVLRPKQRSSSCGVYSRRRHCCAVRRVIWSQRSGLRT
jgi:hypothetical protein